MNNPTSSKLRAWQAFRYIAIAAVVALCGVLFYRGDYSRGIMCLASFVVAFLAARGSLPIRSKDRWPRIAGAGVFVAAAIVFVSVLIMIILTR
jgi:hypothetical protein